MIEYVVENAGFNSGRMKIRVSNKFGITELEFESCRMKIHVE